MNRYLERAKEILFMDVRDLASIAFESFLDLIPTKEGRGDYEDPVPSKEVTEVIYSEPNGRYWDVRVETPSGARTVRTYSLTNLLERCSKKS